MKHEFAATSVTEARYLSRISEKLSCREVFAEYAAWLSAVDTEASAFVTAYSQFAFSESPKPPKPGRLESRNNAWHRMLGCNVGTHEPSWQRRICEVPEPVRPIVESWVRPIVTMNPSKCEMDELPLGSSRFLGAPDLPPDFIWPMSALGPVRFQAQIDLREISLSVATQRYGLPTDGWLVLFAFDDDGESGIQPGVIDQDDNGNWFMIPNLTHVAYIPASAELVRFPIPPETARQWQPNGSCRLVFREQFDVPNASDTENPQLTEDAIRWWLSDTRGWCGRWQSKLMGYPVHGRTDNTSPGPDWMDLFTLGSEEATGWSWCDGQHLDVYVHADGLRDRSFCPFHGYAA